MVWGFGKPTTGVTTTFMGTKLQTAVGADGVWRQLLPSTKAGGPYTIAIAASTGEQISLTNVLFGETKTMLPSSVYVLHYPRVRFERITFSVA